jgi:hypothetical protein
MLYPFELRARVLAICLTHFRIVSLQANRAEAGSGHRAQATSLQGAGLGCCSYAIQNFTCTGNEFDSFCLAVPPLI